MTVVICSPLCPRKSPKEVARGGGRGGVYVQDGQGEVRRLQGLHPLRHSGAECPLA